MKAVWFSDPVMRGLLLPSTSLSSSTGHLDRKTNIVNYSNEDNIIIFPSTSMSSSTELLAGGKTTNVKCSRKDNIIRDILTGQIDVHR